MKAGPTRNYEFIDENGTFCLQQKSGFKKWIHWTEFEGGPIKANIRNLFELKKYNLVNWN